MIDTGSTSISWAAPSDRTELEQWDSFLRDSPRGHYCQLSTWLDSFRSYGFRFEVMLAREAATQRIIGGSGVLRFGFGGFRVAIVPIGPIVEPSHEALSGWLVEKLAERCRYSGAAFLQIQFPCPAERSEPALPALLGTPPSLPFTLESGWLIKVGAAPSQLLWIDFGGPCDDDEWRRRMLARFSSSAARDVRQAEKNGLDLALATSSDELRGAYSLIEKSGQVHGYATRSWNEFGSTLLEQVRRGQASVLVAKYRGEPLGTHYGVIAGCRYSYLMGATVRSQPDLMVGRFLQWQAMLRARALGLRGYDLTSGGSPGVKQFKMSFRPRRLILEAPGHIVFRKLPTVVFRRVYPYAHRHRAAVAGTLSRVRRALRLR